MRIAILTQSLLCNYGCILQNFALQTILSRLGNDVKTIDYLLPRTPIRKLICSNIKAFVCRFVGKKRSYLKYEMAAERNPRIDSFVRKNLSLTKIVRKYTNKIIKLYDFECVVVGSDQVWRQKYNRSLKDMYLDFVKERSIKRIAYAASFGIDDWEYSPKQTEICSILAKKFNAISVREETGVALCKNYLGVDAVCVLDPTLLLHKEEYLVLCATVPKSSEEILAVYMLDVSESIKSFCESEAKKRGLVVKYFTAGTKAALSVPEWLSMFRDASYVVTDSFHGTVFSIIFEKEFKCFYNEKRGGARFESLLNLYNSGKLEKMRAFSIDWLKKALDC